MYFNPFNGKIERKFLDEPAADAIYLRLDATNSPMQGNLSMGGFTFYGGYTGTGNNLVLRSNPEDDGDIILGESLRVKPNGTATNSIGHVAWTRSALYEQIGGGSPTRFFYKACGDRWELLNEAGTAFLMSARGANATNPYSLYWVGAVGIGSGYFNGLLPTNGLVIQGFTGMGRLMTVEQPQAMLHVRQYLAPEITRFEGQTDYGYTGYNTYVRGTNAQRGRIGYDDASQTLITGSLANAFFVNGITALTLAHNSVAIVNINSTDVVVKRTMTTEQGRIKKTTRITNADSPYTILSTDHEIFCDTDSGTITLNLPAGIDGTNYRIINCGSSSNNITINPNGAELLEGDNSSVDIVDAETYIITYETTEGWW